MKRICAAAGFSLCLATASCLAQISTDGSVGPRQDLQGPDYVIGSSLGTINGNNLFQSFSQFNIPKGGSATFTGPPNILDVIARVTGGSPSSIDGTLRLQGMPMADLWILNPAGVMFGANATLDIPASLFVGTGSYLVLGSNGNHFDARQGTNSTLVSAPPTAFGFLGNEPGSVTVAGTLAVSAGHEIGIASNAIQVSGQLLAPSGVISLAAVAGSGETALQTNGSFDTSAFTQLGALELSRTQDMVVGGQNNVDVSNDAHGAGRIFIRAGTFVSDSGSVAANNASDEAGGSIDISAKNSIALTGNSSISSISSGAGQGGSITLSAPVVNMSGGAEISTDSRGAADGGAIGIQADRFMMSDFASITSNAFSSGNGGQINIATTSSIDVKGTSAIRSETFSGGNAGGISLTAPDVSILENGTIEASTFQGSSGNGGSISINAMTFALTGTGQGVAGNSALISTAAGGNGNGGDISIKAKSITLDGLADIRTTSTGSGSAGALDIQGEDVVVRGGSLLDSSSTGSGAGGAIDILGSTLALSEGARISAEATSSGLAGDVNISLGDTLRLVDSSISTSTTSSDGGSISIDVGRDVLLHNSSITTSVQSGIGNGGNVTINAPGFLVLDSSSIKADAFGGAGGNIDITTTQVISSPDSSIEASSELGIQGVVNINAPDSDIFSVIPLVAENYNPDPVAIEPACGSGRTGKKQGVLKVAMDRTVDALTIPACAGTR